MNRMSVIHNRTVYLVWHAVLTLRLLIALERCGTAWGRYIQHTIPTLLKPDVTGQNMPRAQTIPGVNVGSLCIYTPCTLWASPVYTPRYKLDWFGLYQFICPPPRPGYTPIQTTGPCGRGHLALEPSIIKGDRCATARVAYIQWTAMLIAFLSPHKPPNLTDLVSK